MRSHISLYGLCLFFMILVSPVVAVDTFAELSFQKNVGNTINTMDMSYDGSIIGLGLDNGTILTYNKSGSLLLNYDTNGSIVKIVSDKTGNFAWYNTRNESGYIANTSQKIGFVNDSLVEITDVGINRNGSLYAISQFKKLTIYNRSGVNLTTNITPTGIRNWTGIALDPDSNWIAAINESDDRVWLFNISRGIGTQLNMSLRDTEIAPGDIIRITSPEGGFGVVVGGFDFIEGYEIFGDVSAAFYNSMTSYTDGYLYSIATSNNFTGTIEGRDSEINIYTDLIETTGFYPAGGYVNSVDISQTNGLYAIAGGNDGEVYIESKDVSANWYMYYQGVSGYPINAVSMSWDGGVACAGRSNGGLECYNLKNELGAIMDFQVFVYKNGQPYSTFLNIESAPSYPYNWTNWKSNIITDSNGKAVIINAQVGKYYRITASNGTEQKQVIYMADTSTNQVVITIETISDITDFKYYADYNSSYPGNLTIHYADTTTNNSVLIRVAEKDTGKIVYSNQSYYDNKIDVVYQGSPNIAYEIQWVWDRDGVRGMAGKTIFIPKGGGFDFGKVDPTTKHAIFYIFFIFVGGLFTYATREIGAFITSITFGFFILFGFLPITLLNIGGLVIMLALSAVFASSKEKR